MSAAITHALTLLPGDIRPQSVQLPLSNSLFAAVWIGGAGLARLTDLQSIRPRIASLLSISDSPRLLVTSDSQLLSSAIIRPDNAADSDNYGLVLVTGTGSISETFRSVPGSIPASVRRTGGWGYLLGDEGSGYWIGREALRRTLRNNDEGLPPNELHQVVMKHFGCSTIGEIISAIYDPRLAQSPHELSPGTTPIPDDPKLRVAALTPLVFKVAFSGAYPSMAAEAASSIIRAAGVLAIDCVMPLLRDISPCEEATLALGGALAFIPQYRSILVDELRNRGHVFARVEVVTDAAGSAAKLLGKVFLPLAA